MRRPEIPPGFEHLFLGGWAVATLTSCGWTSDFEQLLSSHHMNRMSYGCGWTSDFEQLLFLYGAVVCVTRCGWTSDFEQLLLRGNSAVAHVCCGWTSDFEQLLLIAVYFFVIKGKCTAFVRIFQRDLHQNITNCCGFFRALWRP